MEVALINSNPVDVQCVGLGIILECSQKGTSKGFRVPHSFYVVVKLISVFMEFMQHPLYYEIPKLTTLRESVGFRIL
jgi:hypothetical protein